MRRFMALAALVALVTAACKIETNFGAVINADGSGTIIAEVGMDDEAQSFFMEDIDDPFEDIDLADLPGARTRQERRGDMDFWIVEADVADITAAQSELVGAADSLLETFTITITDELVTVTGTASADDAFGDADEMFDPQVFEDSISANLKITMPGRITSHNATSQDGNTLIWAIPVLSGEPLTVEAQSDPHGTPASGSGGGGIPLWVIVLIVAVIALAALYALNQRKKGGAPQPATAAPTEGTEAPPPPPDE